VETVLIARAPVRISFAGGGTDVPAYYEQFGGLVINTTIDKYFYVIVNQIGRGATQVISADYKTLFSIIHPNFRGRRRSDRLTQNYAQFDPNIQLDLTGDLVLPQAVLDHFGLAHGQSIFLASEIPPGTGLGSSSAAAVCLIKAFSTYRGREMNKRENAELACHIEIEKLNMPIGKQDQYASAYGGVNQFEFSQDGTVKVDHFKMARNIADGLEDWLSLFYTGVSRHSTSILEKQKASMQQEDKKVLENLHFMKELARSMKTCMESGDLLTFGSILDEGWQRKKQLASNISNDNINEVYQAAKNAGAVGGKITGAGGGGFLLLCCSPEKKQAVVEAMTQRNLKEMYFKLETRGAHVVLDNLS
jgi:D-glycero-alpha-D-manno-heptose-7-phosphate kinase